MKADQWHPQYIKPAPLTHADMFRCRLYRLVNPEFTNSRRVAQIRSLLDYHFTVDDTEVVLPESDTIEDAPRPSGRARRAVVYDFVELDDWKLQSKFLRIARALTKR